MKKLVTSRHLARVSSFFFCMFFVARVVGIVLYEEIQFLLFYGNIRVEMFFMREKKVDDRLIFHYQMVRFLIDFGDFWGKF